MTSRILDKVAGFVGSSLVLCACGGRVQSLHDASAGEPSAGSNDAMGGALPTAGGATSVEAGAEAGESSSGAVGQLDAPTVGISGRWAMFDFEDPVGVQLVQTSGSLTGLGCNAGVPPLDIDADRVCSDIQGAVMGNHASFVFHPEGATYITEATVSADGTRMTSRFHGVSAWLPSPTAWLRAPDGQSWIMPYPLKDQPEATGRYNLTVSRAAPGGTEYLSGSTYRLLYDRGKLSGDLGSFWISEITRPSADGPLEVGPVAETDPALPVSLSLDIGAGVFTHVTAKTGSGHEYEFSASVTQ